GLGGRLLEPVSRGELRPAAQRLRLGRLARVPRARRAEEPGRATPELELRSGALACHVRDPAAAPGLLSPARSLHLVEASPAVNRPTTAALFLLVAVLGFAAWRQVRREAKEKSEEEVRLFPGVDPASAKVLRIENLERDQHLAFERDENG